MRLGLVTLSSRNEAPEFELSLRCQGSALDHSINSPSDHFRELCVTST